MTEVTRHEESRRAWWNPWNWPTGIWVLVIGLLLLMLPFGIRTAMLAGVPAMDEPFHVDEFVKWDVPAEEDAFTEYRQAAELRSRIVMALPEAIHDRDMFNGVVAKGWTEVDDSVKVWLEENREALTVWRRGTEKNHALNLPPEKLTVYTEMPTIQDLRLFARMARLEAARCIHVGDLDGALNWLRAAHRSGGHASHRGCFVQGIVGAENLATSTAGMSRWAEQPAVTADQLKKALGDVKSDYTLYESTSHLLKAQYLVDRNSIWVGFSNSVDYLSPSGQPETSSGRFAKRMERWVLGEPELALRILRQILANQIREVDRPLAARRKLAGTGYVMLFDHDPTVPLLPGQLDPIGIDCVVRRSSLAFWLLSAVDQFDTVFRRQAARQATIEIVLAAQAYRRDHGEFPDSLQRLVPDYLASVPADPCDPFGGPVLYRRDEALQAVVWSVGDDGIDDGGDVESSTNQSSDVGFMLK